jgi:hypothetical protein
MELNIYEPSRHFPGLVREVRVPFNITSSIDVGLAGGGDRWSPGQQVPASLDVNVRDGPSLPRNNRSTTTFI